MTPETPDPDQGRRVKAPQTQKMTDLLARDAKVVLRPDANTSHDDARNMYDCYGAHVTDHEYDQDGELVRERDIELQVVEYEWLDDDDDDAVTQKIVAEVGCSKAVAEQLLALARQVRRDMEAVERDLDEAVKAYDTGDINGVIEALRSARGKETEHGDDPSTSELVEKLLEPKTAWRVYCCPDGCCASYCGEYDTQEEAEEIAESEPIGLEESMWATARAAGHCAGMTAPGDGEEDEPESWHGAAGYHCVVKVTY